ncbi:MAG: autotransporter domain-containing protein, partial [Holosporaceae bacterium]|nr:autotransporter domain-containing protein [Holosporaceae bacterium]
SNTTISGLKFSWLNEDYGNVSVICSYGGVKSCSKNSTLRNHVLSLSSRYDNSFRLNKYFSVVPLVQLDYTNTIVKNAQIEQLLVNYENCHSLRASAGLNLQYKMGNFKASIGTKFSKRFGEEISGTSRGLTIKSSEKISRSYGEYNAKISGKINNTMSIELVVGKSYAGRKGTCANLSIAAAI